MEVREDPHPSPTAGERVGLAHPGAVLLDIEGTTTPISFVYETLFSYARARLKDFVASPWPALEHDLGLLRQAHAADLAAGMEGSRKKGRDLLVRKPTGAATSIRTFHGGRSEPLH